ncbi:MAG: ABC transporter substrate-binding protein [Trueperaceae bacterium]
MFQVARCSFRTTFLASLRTFLAGLAALALLAGASAQDAPEPVHGGEVTVAITADPPGWDPTASTSQEIPRVVYHNVFEGLVRFDASGAIVPALAESWELSDDGLALTFQVREGVSFHDGSPLTLDDVVAKFERATDPDSGHTNPQYYDAIENVVTDEDAHTVTFELSRPSQGLLYNLARPDGIVYPAGTAETQRSRPVGTGPFRFASYLEGNEVRLERFEDYYLDGVPYLDAVTFRIIGDPNTRFAALQAGDIDLIGTALPPEQFLQLANDPNLKGTEGTATTEITLALNNAREPLSDPLVRQAITHAIDKNAIVDGAMFGLGTPIGTHMSPAEPYYVDLTGTYPYDPERARELLAEAGYEDGFTVSFELPEPYNIERRSGQVIAQQLAEVGITVELSVVEWGTWIQRIFLGGDYDMTIIGHSEPRDINVYANPEYYYHYDNPEIGQLLAQAEAATTEDASFEAYQEIARTIAEDAVNVWVFSPPYLVAARSDVHGFWTDQPTPSIDVTGVYRAD